MTSLTDMKGDFRNLKEYPKSITYFRKKTRCIFTYAIICILVTKLNSKKLDHVLEI